MEQKRAKMPARTATETAMEHGREPYLFIVGCARSGTTLLHRMVDAHPLVAVLHELHWVTGYFKERKIRKPTDPVTPDLAAGIMNSHRFPRLKIGREDFKNLLDPGKSISYAEFLSSIFELYGKSKGKPLVGNKTPAYVRSIPTLHALWPHAKFVHIIRDGRDVALSAMNWDRGEAAAGRYATWKEDPISTTALWWRRKVLLGREGGRSVGPGLYHEVSYESLTTRPADECGRLCAFLGLPYDEAMLSFDEGRSRTDPVDPDHPWLPVTTGMRDWRREMLAEDLERFEAAAGDLLDELGYKRAYPHPTHQALEHAARIHHTFTEDLRSRGRRLPDHWETI